jgi:engulfment/cell motility protein 1
VSNLTDIRMQTSRAINSRSPNMISKLSFSLMSGSELSLLDADAVHAAQLAEWTDGIRVLRGEVGMSTKETAGFVHVSRLSPPSGGGTQDAE